MARQAELIEDTSLYCDRLPPVEDDEFEADSFSLLRQITDDPVRLAMDDRS